MDFVRLPEWQTQWCAPGSSALFLGFPRPQEGSRHLMGWGWKCMLLWDGKSDSSILLLKHCLGRTSQAGFLCLSFSVKTILKEKCGWRKREDVRRESWSLLLEYHLLSQCWAPPFALWKGCLFYQLHEWEICCRSTHKLLPSELVTCSCLSCHTDDAPGWFCTSRSAVKVIFQVTE